MLESPKSTLHRIAIARYKNFWIFLSAVFGVGATYAILWYGNMGARLGGLGSCLAIGVLLGPVLGVAFVVLASMTTRLISQLLGGRSTQRTTMAVLAYSMVPIAISVVLVFPVEVAVFGKFLFDQNPPPQVIDYAAYVTLVAMDAILALWSLVLMCVGIQVTHRMTWGRAFVSFLSIPALALGILMLGIRI
jgi:hypothetical protein